MKKDKVSYSFRMPRELRDKLQALADSEQRKLSNMIVVVLQKCIQMYEAREWDIIGGGLRNGTDG